MNIDAITFYLFACELEEKLVDARIQKIFQSGVSEFIFRMRLPGENYFLFVSLEPENQRIHPIPQKFARSIEPSPFCMMLRKHIEGGRILYLGQQGSDRILQIAVSSFIEGEGAHERILIIELTGKTSNLILCDEKERILGALNRKDHRRDLSNGQVYEPPPPPQGINPFLIEKKDFLGLFESEKVREKPVKDIIFDSFTGMTGDYVREILYHSGVGTSTPAKNLGTQKKEKIWESFSRFLKRIRDRDIKPVVYYARDDESMKSAPERFAPWEFDIYADRPKEFLTYMGDALQAVFFPLATVQSADELKKDLKGAIEKQIKKVKKRIEKQEEDLRKIEGDIVLKKWGELILANIGKIPEKASSVEVEDYYEDSPKKVVIKLDPSLTPSENAQAYFKKYKKANRGIPILKERIEISKEELQRLEGYLYELETAESPADLEVLAETLEMEEIYSPPALPGKKKSPAPSEPRKFELAPGYVVLVGRNSRQNEELTLRIAQNEDLFFHARGMPGSHTVLRIQKPSKPVPDEIIYKTACIAAYYSKGRSSTKVPVSYAKIKDVRKVKGMKTGSVLISKEKTIMAKPEIG